jgi:hypothetical protein
VDDVKLVLTLDNALHALAGGVLAFALAYVLPGWAVVGLVAALGFIREGWQGYSDLDQDGRRGHWPARWGRRRWIEAIAWLPGAIVGAAVQAVAG